MASSRHLNKFLKKRSKRVCVNSAAMRVENMLREYEFRQEIKRRILRRRQRQNVKYASFFAGELLENWEIYELGMTGTMPFSGEVAFSEYLPRKHATWCQFAIRLRRKGTFLDSFKMWVRIDWKEKPTETSTAALDRDIVSRYKSAYSCAAEAHVLRDVARRIMVLKFARMEDSLRDLGIHLPGLLDCAVQQ